MTDNPFAFDYREPEPSTSVGGVGEASAPATITPGFHQMDAATYHADPAPTPSLSSTLAKVITSKSPLHAWHACRRLNPDCVSVERKAFDIGTAAHRALLGVGEDYVAIPGELLATNGAASTKEAKAFIADARASGRTPLKADEVDQVEAMRAAAVAKLNSYGIHLDPARSEMAAFAEIDGIWCRALFDNAPEATYEPLYDYKTCEDASPEACLKSIINYGYDVQAAHYLAVWKAITGEDRAFTFIFQEKPAPHEVTLIRLSGSFRDLGENRAARARKLWRECVTTNNWPGYGNKSENARATKTRRKDVPWDPASDGDLMFEMTAMIILDPIAPGCPVHQIKVADQFKGLLNPQRPMSEATGHAMAEWAKGQGGAQKQKEVMDLAREKARGGTEVFTAWWQSGEGKEARPTVRPIMDEIQALCRVADELAAMPDDVPFVPEGPADEQRGDGFADEMPDMERAS